MRRSDANSWTASPQRLRRGIVSIYFLFFMLITVTTMFVAVDLWRIAEGKVQQQRFCDACAHAAALALTGETTSGLTSPLLFDYPNDIKDLCQTTAIAEANKYADMNFVDGAKLALDTSTVNKDVKFGKFDFDDAAPAFALIDPTTATMADRRSINAVRVEGFRTLARKNAVRIFGPAWTAGATHGQIVTRTTAVLDRRVVGFRIQNNLAATPVPLSYQTIPMAPVALLEEGAESWKTMVETPADMTKSPIPYGSMVVKIPTTSSPTTNAQLLDIGVAATQADLDAQILNGVTSAQMAVYNPTTKDMILDVTTKTVNVPQFAAPAYDAAMKANFTTLMTAKTERIFPLYKVLSGSNVVVTGFVAARVTAVNDAVDGSKNSYISLTLQPTLLETPTAFTDYSNRFWKTATPAAANSGPPSPYAGYARLVNAFICRVRLVD